jgi:hypothetical protein
MISGHTHSLVALLHSQTGKALNPPLSAPLNLALCLQWGALLVMSLQWDGLLGLIDCEPSSGES